MTARALPLGPLAVRRPAVLAYHGIGDPDPARLCTPVDRLERHVRWLQRAGFRFTTAAELAGRPAGPGEAVLTFDDGFTRWLTDLLPLLERLRVPASLYVNPGLLGGQHADVAGPDGRLLTRDETAELAASPWVDLGSHALTHRDLRLHDDATLRRELVDSRDALEQLTGRPCPTLAYPFGLHDARVRDAAGEAGYALAWDWLPGPWTDSRAAPRMPAPTTRGPLVLGLKLAGVRRRWGR